MSRVTNVTLMVYCDEDSPTMAGINKVLEEKYRQSFKRVLDDSVGGSKYLEVELWAAAFNHIEPSALADIIESANWGEFEYAVLTCVNQDDQVTSRIFKGNNAEVSQEDVIRSDATVVSTVTDAGCIYNVKCPECLDVIRVGDYSWWSTMCSCGRTWSVEVIAEGRLGQ